ncbi:hypothetical protein VTK26DRAFT_1288 [Humicola hyalothermophila]
MESPNNSGLVMLRTRGGSCGRVIRSEKTRPTPPCRIPLSAHRPWLCCQHLHRMKVSASDQDPGAQASRPLHYLSSGLLDGERCMRLGHCVGGWGRLRLIFRHAREIQKPLRRRYR